MCWTASRRCAGRAGSRASPAEGRVPACRRRQALPWRAAAEHRCLGASSPGQAGRVESAQYRFAPGGTVRFGMSQVASPQPRRSRRMPDRRQKRCGAALAVPRPACLPLRAPARRGAGGANRSTNSLEQGEGHGGPSRAYGAGRATTRCTMSCGCRGAGARRTAAGRRRPRPPYPLSTSRPESRRAGFAAPRRSTATGLNQRSMSRPMRRASACQPVGNEPSESGHRLAGAMAPDCKNLGAGNK